MIGQIDVRGDRHPRPTIFLIRALFPLHKIAMKTNHMSQGLPKGTTGIPIGTRNGTKESSGYNVSGTEGVGETHITAYLRTNSTMGVGYVS